MDNNIISLYPIVFPFDFHVDFSETTYSNGKKSKN